MVDTVSLKLTRVIENFRKPSAEELAELIKVAESNKVLLGFLRRVDIKNETRNIEEERYRRFVSWIKEIVSVLKGLDYALYKFRKPVKHVPTDVDLLVRDEDLNKAYQKLRNKGFLVDTIDKYTLTLRRGLAIIDLYIQPAFAWVVYMSGSKLLDCCVEEIDVNGVDAKALTKEAEVVVSAAHAVYKEHIYLLLDYFTIKKWVGKRALNLASELGVEDALRVSVKLNEMVDKGFIELPYKLPMSFIASLYMNKMIVDPFFRGTSLNFIKYLLSRRAGKILLWRLRRISY